VNIADISVPKTDLLRHCRNLGIENKNQHHLDNKKPTKTKIAGESSFHALPSF